MRSDALVLAAATWTQTEESLALDMVLPAGARRLVLEATGAGALLERAQLQVLAVVPRSERAELPWPRNPDPEAYRRGTGRVRLTSIDLAGAEAEGFRLADSDHRFLVDAPCEATVRVSITPPTRGETLQWAGRRLVSDRAGAWDLPAREGKAVAGTCLIPLGVRAPGALLVLSEAPARREGP
jgi:hypothetical protein